MNRNEMAVYQWFERNADGDGFIEAAAANVAMSLSIPTRTVQGVLQRLEDAGHIYLISYRRFAVTRLVE
jgi:hypothetical protein